MSVYVLVLKTQSGNGIVLTRDKQPTVMLFKSIGEAHKSIDYGKQDTSAVLHWMAFHPHVLKLSGKTDEECMEFVNRICSDSAGKMTVTRLSAIMGSATILQIKNMSQVSQGDMTPVPFNK